jgi:protein-disulfide isomerase
MSLLPKYAVYSLQSSSQEQRRHTVDLFLDLVCPFSARLWSTVVGENNLPNKYKSRIEFIFRHQIQPWHTQSALVHTVIMGVAREQPSRLFDAITGLFKRQRELFDEHVEEKSQVEIYEKILSILNEETQIKLDINLFRTKRTESNAGNSITTDLKYHIKYARKHGVHVSPTVFVDGLEEPDISSQWTVEQWNTYIDKLQ